MTRWPIPTESSGQPLSARRRVRCGLAFGLIVSALVIAAPARAETETNQADALFREGQRLLKEGKVTDACRLLAESHAAQPALGTLLNLAVCHEREHKTATAWHEYSDAMRWAGERGEAARAEYAREHMRLLEPRVPKLRILVADSPERLAVVLDGRRLPADDLGVDLPVDPGHHRVEVTAAGKRPWLHDDAIAEGAGVILVDVRLHDEPKPSVAPTPSSGARQRWGYAVGGAGLVALSGGVVLLLRARAFDRKSDHEAEVARMFDPVDATFKAAALDDHRAAVQTQTWALGLLGAGLGAAGAGALLVFAPSDVRRANAAPDARGHSLVSYSATF